MQQPLITIITIAYNSQHFIKQAIETVLHQSYQNFEYLIIDDCSTDSTWQIINTYNDSRISAIKNEKNIGEYNNRNKAINLAQGEYTVFIDGDDIALQKGIELAVVEMEKYKQCSFGMVKTENPKYIGTVEIAAKDAYNLEYFGGGFVMNSSLANNIFRTHILKQYLFDINYLNADCFLRLSLLKFSNVLVLINPIAIWRLTPQQQSKKIQRYQQLQQQLQFMKNEIFEDKNFTFFNKENLKPRYYNILRNAVVLSIKKLQFKQAISYKKYLIDSFGLALNYSIKTIDTTYWNHYNYNNVNVKIG